MKQFKYSALVLAGASLWGVEALFVNPLSDGGFGAMQISFLGAFMSMITAAVWMLLKDRSAFKAGLKDLVFLALNALVVSVSFNSFYYTTIIHSQACVAAMLAYTSPVFVMILSRIIFKERMTGRKYLALIMTITGCAFVTGFVGQAQAIPVFALCTGLAAGASYAVFTILTRYSSQRCSPLTVLFYTLLFGTVFLLPVSHPVRILSALERDHSLIPYVLLFGPVCNTLANGLYTWGVSKTPAGRAAILGAAEPLVGALIGMTVYTESHEPLKLLGIALVLAAIIIGGLESESAA